MDTQAFLFIDSILFPSIDDLIDKLSLYQKHGVREYWIVDPENEKVLVYFFERSELLSIYTFDSDIPVGIYDGKLCIRINDMI